jgi:hypothetical protein
MSLPSIHTLRHFEHFLLAYVHTILYLRLIYSRTIFLEASLHNTSIFQSRSRVLCRWIWKAVEAACTQLLTSKWARIGVDVFTETDKHADRYVFDVSEFNMKDWNNMRLLRDNISRNPTTTRAGRPARRDVKDTFTRFGRSGRE